MYALSASTYSPAVVINSNKPGRSPWGNDILGNGGGTDHNRVWNMILASRGFGDFETKDINPKVFTAIPTVKSYKLTNLKYIMITSDGITDEFTQKYKCRKYHWAGRK